MSQRLVTITNSHMQRLAQYSAVICEIDSDLLFPPDSSATLGARLMLGLVAKLTINFMLHAAFCSDCPDPPGCSQVL